MRKKRMLIEGAAYHVTSRTNNKINVFEKKQCQRIFLFILEEAQEKFCFELINFCVMPTHVHLLIKPADGTELPNIMQWIKTKSAKCWNRIKNTTDHFWGDRYFANAIQNENEFETVMNYIDQNPVKAGLAASPEDWKPSGAYLRSQDSEGVCRSYHLLI